VRRVLIRIAVLLAALATEPVLGHHSPLHFGGSAAELLAPEKAFAMSARALDARTVEVSFAIADGYDAAGSPIDACSDRREALQGKAIARCCSSLRCFW